MVAGFCEYSNAPLDSIKGGEFLDQLSIPLASLKGFCSMELIIYINYE
jgi:hypothetical protein